MGYKDWPWDNFSKFNENNTGDYHTFPKISIITPSFNQGAFIEETIRSIVFQGYPNLEYIIIDGGSSDNTLDIIKKYETYLTYWVSEKDKGQSEAINKGFKLATGEIITWICSDDLLMPNALNVIAKHYLFNDKSFALISGNVIPTTNLNHKEQIKNAILWTNDQLNNNLNQPIIADRATNACKEEMLCRLCFSQPGTFFKRKLLTENGYLNEHLHYGMDFELFQRFIVCNNILFINEIVALARYHDRSKGSAVGWKFLIEWNETMFAFFLNVSNNIRLKKFIATFSEKKHVANTNNFTTGIENIDQGKLNTFVLAYSMLRFHIHKEYFNSLKVFKELKNHVNIHDFNIADSNFRKIVNFNERMPLLLAYFLEKGIKLYRRLKAYQK
jgi:glycosyltransferase involved in cell wall biosynthesis